MTPIITTTQNEVIVRIPIQEGGMEVQRVSIKNDKIRSSGITDWDSLIGILADNPRFKGKTSIEVQHMLKEVWSKKYSS